MSYRIEYGPSVPAQYRKKSDPRRLQTLTAVFLLLFVFLVRQFFPAGTLKLRQMLLPASPGITQTALMDMMRSIRAGVSTTDAFTAFCQQIIENDKTLSH